MITLNLYIYAPIIKLNVIVVKAKEKVLWYNEFRRQKKIINAVNTNKILNNFLSILDINIIAHKEISSAIVYADNLRGVSP